MREAPQDAGSLLLEPRLWRGTANQVGLRGDGEQTLIRTGEGEQSFLLKKPETWLGIRREEWFSNYMDTKGGNVINLSFLFCMI